MKPPTFKRDDNKKANKPLVTGKNILDMFVTPSHPITGQAMNEDVQGRSTSKN